MTSVYMFHKKTGNIYSELYETKYKMMSFLDKNIKIMTFIFDFLQKSYYLL